MKKLKQQRKVNHNQVQTFRKQAQLDSYSYHVSLSFYRPKKSKHGKREHTKGQQQDQAQKQT